jgi:hypothetical protein
VTNDLETPKVMCVVWVVGVAEIIIDGDGPDDPGNGFRAESGDTGRQES